PIDQPSRSARGQMLALSSSSRLAVSGKNRRSTIATKKDTAVGATALPQPTLPAAAPIMTGEMTYLVRPSTLLHQPNASERRSVGKSSAVMVLVTCKNAVAAYMARVKATVSPMG